MLFYYYESLDAKKRYNFVLVVIRRKVILNEKPETYISQLQIMQKNYMLI